MDAARALQAGVRLLQRSRPQEALEHLLKAVTLAPSDPRAWFVSGLALRGCGDLGAAADALRRAVALDPRAADAWSELGAVLAAMGVRDEPAQCWQRALAVVPSHTEAGVRLAQHWTARGALDQAGEILGPLLRERPEDPGVCAAAVALLERRGRVEEAWELAASFSGDDPRVALKAASVGRRTGNSDRALQMVDRALGGAGRQERALLLHARGDLLDGLDRVEEAFEAYVAANAARGLSFDATRHEQAVERVIAACTSRRRGRGVVDGSERPVLVVGVPRTGSTVLEQALSRHPEVAACGELEALRDVALAVPRGGERDWVDALDRIGGDLAEQARLRARYLGALPGTTSRATDKMPNNLLHLGLLAAILPETRVIRCERDPVDTAWSCFRQAFGAGLPWATSWEGIATWIRCARRLLDHSEEVLPLRFLTVRYEALAQRPEETLRGVLGHLDLPFYSSVLSPERAERQVATASAIEVKDALHSRSIGRAERYEALLPREILALREPSVRGISRLRGRTG